MPNQNSCPYCGDEIYSLEAYKHHVKTCANHKHFLCLGCNIEFKYDFTFSKLIEANINET